METHEIEVASHFVFAGESGDIWEVIDLDLVVFCFDVSDGQWLVGPEDVIDTV